MQNQKKSNLEELVRAFALKTSITLLIQGWLLAGARLGPLLP